MNQESEWFWLLLGRIGKFIHDFWLCLCWTGPFWFLLFIFNLMI